MEHRGVERRGQKNAMSKTDLSSLPETPAGASGVRAPAFPLATGYRLLCSSKEYKLTRKCPYCGGALRMTINGCELDEATGWIATDLDINCDTEPDIDGPDWVGWWADHSHDFCHAWHDLHERLVACLKFTHRVSHDND